MYVARIRLKIRAGAKRTEFAGKLGDVWKLQVAAPQVSGFAPPMKTVEIEVVDSDAMDRAILESHGTETHTGIA